MSKSLKPTVFVNEKVTSIGEARSFAEKALSEGKSWERELWGLVMATPKDIVADGEDPVEVLKERFDSIIGYLWEAYVDEYKYTAIADDAEYDEDSLVSKAFDAYKKDEEDMKHEKENMEEFFQKYDGVLSKYNFDDYEIYREWSDGSIKIPSPFTKEDRNRILKQIREKEEKILKEAFKKVENNGKQRFV